MKNAVLINKIGDLRESTIELVLKLYFDSNTDAHIDAKSNKITFTVRDNHTEYATIKAVVSSGKPITEIKSILDKYHLYWTTDSFDKVRYSKLVDYDYFDIIGDPNGNGHIVKYIVSFNIPEFIDSEKFFSIIYAVKTAAETGLIASEKFGREDYINNMIKTIAVATKDGQYNNSTWMI